MLLRPVFTLLLSILLTTCLVSQKTVKSYIFGHSLIHHEYQLNPTPSQETSIPHWIHFLAEAANNSYSVSGQYGFLPQHAINLPPQAQWGFDFATAAWDSDYEAFSDVDFTQIMVTPGNFIQWQGPTENYPNKVLTPISATKTIFDWCNAQEDSLEFYIYENWPDMAQYLSNDFPPSSNEWEAYNVYLNGEFHDWFVGYHDILTADFPSACVKMIPVGPVISSLLSQPPYNQIPIDALYEDDAPHGRPTIYFLASVISYMAMYAEKTPIAYQIDPIIHPLVRDNYENIVNYVWDELLKFKFSNGESRVFCDLPITNSLSNSSLAEGIIVKPNPVSDYLEIEATIDVYQVDIFGLDGKLRISTDQIFGSKKTIDLTGLPQAIYGIRVINKDGVEVYRDKLVKL